MKFGIKRIGCLAVLCASIAVLPLASPAWGQEASKSVASGAKWVVDKTTSLKSLTIAEGATVASPKGYNVTMTVDGVERAIKPGSYKGAIVLTATKDIPLSYMNQGDKEPYHVRAAVFVDNGAYVPEKSVAAAAVGAKVTNSYLADATIKSDAEKFNGIYVTGNSTYAILNPKIEMTGNGGDDFAGYGSAIKVDGKANVTINNAKIVNKGAVRTAIWIGGKSTVTVNNSDIDTYSGTLPAGYTFSIMPSKMMEVPYGLGVSGNLRATNLMDEATVIYNNSHIRAHGWGALSTDGNGPTRMFVNNSVIETVNSGYGAFANGDSHDQFSNCTFNVASYGVIIGGPGWATFTDATKVNSNGIGVVMQQGSGGSLLTINKKSVVKTRLAAIEIKGRGGNVVIDNAEVQPGNGVILQTMENDDPIQKEMKAGGGGAPGGGGMPSGGAPGGGAPGGGSAPGGMPGGAPAGAQSAPNGGDESFSGDVVATLRNATLTGDLVHSMKGVGEMRVKLEKATVTGAISTGTAYPTSGKEPTKETFSTIGDVKNTLSAVDEKYGLKVALDGQSKWVVDKTSYLNSLTLDDGAVIAAPAGSSVRLVVDGVNTPVKAGSYKGKIELQVTPGA